MRITNRILRKIIKEELAATYMVEQGIFDQPGAAKSKEDEEDEEPKGDEDDGADIDYDPAGSEKALKPAIKKLLDPNMSPQKFAAFDAEMDEKGSIQDQAAAEAGFALTYADGDEKEAQDILKKAIPWVKKMAMSDEAEAAQRAEAEGEEKKTEGIARARMQEIIKEEIARHLLGS